MAAAITKVSGTRIESSGDHFVGYFNIVLSGSYPGSGGDTLDFRPFFPGNSVPSKVDVDGESGYKYDYVKGTTLGNGKLRVGVNVGATANLGLTEHTTAAYDAAAAADLIRAEVKVKKYKA